VIGRKQGGKGWRRAAAWAALAGFLFHIAVKASGVVLMPPQFAGLAASGGVYSVVLCTARGMERIVLDENGAPVGGPWPISHEVCPVCAILAGAALPAPLADAPPPSLVVSERLRLGEAADPRPLPAVHSYRSRAPPLSVHA